MALRISQTALLTDAALKGYWKCDGNFNDSSPSGYNLTPVNSPTFVTGQFDQAANFVGTSLQYANIGYASCPDIIISGSQSWVCWFNCPSINSYKALMSLDKTTGGVFRGFITSGDLGYASLGFALAGLTTNESVNSTNGALVNGNTYHLAGVYNGSTLKLYINGVENASVTASGSPTAITSGGFALGRQMNTSFPFYYTGWIDDVAIFSKALTPTEVLNLATGVPANFMMMF